MSALDVSSWWPEPPSIHGTAGPAVNVVDEVISQAPYIIESIAALAVLGTSLTLSFSVGMARAVVTDGLRLTRKLLK